MIWLVQPFSSSSLILFESHSRPSHHGPERPPAQKMHVQVIHLLAAMRIAIDNQTVAALGDPLLSCEIARHYKHVANQRFILVGNIIGGGNGFVRDN